MTELKTKQNNTSVNKFINKVTDRKKREDCFSILELMKQITKEEPKMWGTSIVGFGKYHYRYESGREGDMPLTGFSPRTQNITIYLMINFGKNAELMKKLGKYKTGKSCLYLKNLDDIDVKILKKLISESVKYISKKKWP